MTINSTTAMDQHSPSVFPVSNILLPSVGIIIPYLSRKAHLSQAIESWSSQHYHGIADIVVVDFSDEPSDLNLKKVRVVRPRESRWNIAKAKNIGARRSYANLLIFAPADALVEKTFVADIASNWNNGDLWLPEPMLTGVPYDPSLGGLLAVKRWVNTKLRGFSEAMMLSPYGWGFDNDDYVLRAKAMLSVCGGRITDYPAELASILSNTSAERAEPYGDVNIDKTYRAHAAYSLGFREKYGWSANWGADWGEM